MIKVLMWSMLLALFSAGTCLATTEVGERAEAAFGVGTDGEPVTPEALHGKVVLAMYWVSWCGYCRKAMPDFIAFQQAVADRGLQVVFINHKEDRKLFRDAARKLKKTGVLMVHDRDGELGDKYGVESYPHILVMDRDGRVRRSTSGYGTQSRDRYAELLAQLLSTASAQATTEVPPAATAPDAPMVWRDNMEIDRAVQIPAPELELDLNVQTDN